MNNLQPRQSFLLIFYGVMIGLMVGGLIWIISSPPRGKPVTISTRSPDLFISVYISGEVLYPGVYQLPKGSRVKDVIEIAGGLLPNADVARINQAAIVDDSDHINIVPVNSQGVIENSGLNINTATEAELQNLPGIGPVFAKSIVDYRTENGPFRNIEEIQKVSGIGPKTYENIKNLIYVGD